MIDIEFLKRLKQKLQIGNTRSIHLNAFPGRLATRLDLTDLNNIQNNLANKFLDQLLTIPKFNFKFQINYDENLFDKNEKIKVGLVSKRLTSILYENEDNYLEHGIKTFGFGFPILIYKPHNDPQKTINAPLFIWNLDLKRDRNNWSILRDEDFTVTMNEALLNYLEQDLNTQGLTRISDEYLTDNIIDKDEVSSLSNTILLEINKNSNNTSFDGNIIPLENKDNLREQFVKKGNPWISYSGIFGLFRVQKEAVIKDIKELISKYGSLLLDNLKIERYQTISFSPIETDPTQKKALKGLNENNKLIIHGPPGTGKSQSLTAIIVNALANKVKCLVVCEKKTALDVIKKNLEKIGLSEICGLIEDVNRDRKNIVSSFRERNYNLDSYNLYSIDNLLNDTNNQIDKVNNGHRFYDKKLLLNSNWTEIVGRYLKLTKATSLTQVLFQALKNNGYGFNRETISEDFVKYSESISNNFRLYKETEKIVHVFEYLNDSLFSNITTKELILDLKDYLNNIIVTIDNCIKEGRSVLEKYENASRKHFSEYYEENIDLIKKLNELYDKNITINKNLFVKDKLSQNSKLIIFSFFSKKYKNLKYDKLNFNGIFDKIYFLSQYKYFNHELSNEDKDLNTRRNLSNNYHINLSNWYSGLNDYISSFTKMVNDKNNNKQIDFNEILFDNFNGNFFKIISELNKSAIFSKEFVLKHDSIFERLEYLTRVKFIIQEIINNIYDLNLYAEWRINYTKQDNLIIQIIDLLILNKSKNWNIDFEAWFLFNILNTNEHSISLKNESNLQVLNENFKKINKWQVSSILDYWRSKQENSRMRFNQNNSYNANSLYNLSRNKNFIQKNPVRKIINTDFELFTDHFPVMLINPTICSSLFKMEEGLFDVVIFDEASQLKIEDVFAAQLRGKYKIVSGDENQMPPSNYFNSALIQLDSSELESEDGDGDSINISKGLADSESLLEYAIQTGYKETYLEIHYRSKHPDLIEFSNAAFYGTRLKPLPPRTDYKALRYYNLEGIYNQDEGINETEAKKVIDIIDDIVDLEKNIIPSIGVATLNIFQRNYILNQIKIRSDKNINFERKIEILNKKRGEELFVKNLENIQGDERDIIILSTTFGLKEDGSPFTQHFGPINQAKGFRLLNVIVTRAKKKVFVCTSIPESKISEYSKLLESNENKGRGVFYAYLAYAKAIEENNIDMKESILTILAKNCDTKYYQTEYNMTESVFEQEVYDILTNNIESLRIETQYKLGGFRIDIVIKSTFDNKPIIAIECDGAKYHSSPEAYAWDMFRQKFLEDYGLKFIRIWSVNWWNNPNYELERIIKFIYEVDKLENESRLFNDVKDVQNNQLIEQKVVNEFIEKEVQISDVPQNKISNNLAMIENSIDEEKNLKEWFNSIDSETWFQIGKLGKEKKILGYYEIDFAYKMNKYRKKNWEPSLKQLNYASKVYEKYTKSLKK